MNKIFQFILKRAIKFIVPFFLILNLMACANTVSLPETRSGKPEAFYDTKNIEEVSAALSANLLNYGFNITRSDKNLVVAEKPATDLMVTAFFGTQFSGAPFYRISFSIVPDGARTRIVATPSLVTNPGTGLEKVRFYYDLPGTEPTVNFMNLFDKFPPKSRTPVKPITNAEKAGNGGICLMNGKERIISQENCINNGGEFKRIKK